MKKILLLTLLTLIFSLASFAQTKDDMAASLDLASSPPCGVDEKPRHQMVVGTVMKREFAEDEMTLSGVVIKESKDQRTFVNLDVEYLQGETGNLTAQLSEFLAVGKRVTLKTDVCGRTLTLRRLMPVK